MYRDACRTEMPTDDNPLTNYFDTYHEGPGLWKWRHYLDVYHRHFKKFRQRQVHVVEVGVYSGGSLQMWRDYFGPDCHVYGIDIEEQCKTYESDHIKIFTGDQSSRRFWREFKQRVPQVDILIDDGGHLPKQQIVTFEEIFPHLSPGGVYLCEDIVNPENPFYKYICRISQSINSFDQHRWKDEIEKAQLVCPTSEFQTWHDSFHFYPFVIVAEKRSTPATEFVASKRGTQWQPFLNDR